MPDPIIQKDTERVQRALTNAQRTFGAAATLVSDELRNIAPGTPGKAEIFRVRMINMIRGVHPTDYVESLERVAAQIRAQRPERWKRY